MPNKACGCGRKFAIRSSDSAKNPQRLYYKCDVCDTFKWCKGNVDKNVLWGYENQSKGGKTTHGSETVLKHELKELKKRVAKQQKIVNGSILFVFIVFLTLK